MYKRFCHDRLDISRSTEYISNTTIMKLIAITLLAIVAVAAAAPAEKELPKIVRSEFEQNPDGAYNFAFETDDGTNRNEAAEVKELKDEDNKPVNVLTVRGSYSYVDPDGHTQTVTYFADETGFHAEGDSLPKSA